MKRIPWKRISLFLLAAAMLLSFTACGMEQELADLGAAAIEAALSESASTTAAVTSAASATTATTPAAATTTTTAAETTPATTTTTAATTTAASSTTTVVTFAATTTAASAEVPDEDGYYYQLEDVVRYLEAWGHLPDNFITKNEAAALGWTGGSVQRYQKGAAIGGDRFGNREGLLPKASGRTYTECDIDTDGASSRGAKRLVFSSDGLYFYTDDHYESFRQVFVSDTGEVTIE